MSRMFLSWALPRSHFVHLSSIGSDRNISIKGLYYHPVSLSLPLTLPLTHTSTLYFKSAYNVQIVVADDEPEDRLVNRFRKEVLKAGVLQECRRRRFFENRHDKIKRKARQASRRNRKRKPWTQNKRDSQIKKNHVVVDDDDDIDHWDLPGVDIPYT